MRHALSCVNKEQRATETGGGGGNHTISGRRMARTDRCRFGGRDVVMELRPFGGWDVGGHDLIHAEGKPTRDGGISR